MKTREVMRSPIAFGPAKIPAFTRWGGYDHMDVTFKTDFDTLAKLLPEGYKLVTPNVHVYQKSYKQYSYNAGRCYYYFGLGIDAAPTSGPNAGRVGWYLPVCWMNDYCAIIAGRDIGNPFPKLYAQLNEPVETDNGWYISCSEYNHKMIEFEIFDMVPRPKEEVMERNRAGFKSIWLLDKGPIPAYTRVDSQYYGKGSVKFNDTTWEDAPSSYYIINYLQKLPNLGIVGASRSTGSIEMGPNSNLAEYDRRGLIPGIDQL